MFHQIIFPARRIAKKAAIATGAFMALAAVSVTSAHAVPVVFNISGSGTGTSISGTITVDSANITGSGNNFAVDAFSISDSIVSFSVDQNSSNIMRFTDASDPAQQFFGLDAFDAGANLVLVSDGNSFIDTIFTYILTPGGTAQGEDITGLATITLASSTAIAEPGTLAVLGLGLVGLGYARRRRKA